MLIELIIYVTLFSFSFSNVLAMSYDIIDSTNHVYEESLNQDNITFALETINRLIRTSSIQDIENFDVVALGIQNYQVKVLGTRIIISLQIAGQDYVLSYDQNT